MLETFTGFIMAEHLYNQVYVPPTGKMGHSTTVTPYRRPLKTADGYLAVLPNARRQSAKLMELGGLPGAYESDRFLGAEGAPARLAAYYGMMDDAALAHTTDEWLALCAEHSIPAMRANRPMEIFDDPQLRQTLFETRGLEGEGRYRAMKPGLRFSKTPVSIRYDPPPIGHHTAEILAELGEDED